MSSGNGAAPPAWTVLEGDCLARMAELPADSVDAIVCDPPYELGFMGRGWDAAGVAFNPDVWREALRVAKPGAYLVAFGGTRTYHRLAVAIEDGGWEIRDGLGYAYDVADQVRALWPELGELERQAAAAFLASLPAGPLAWMYGQGFPKSHDVAKAIDKERDDRAYVLAVTRFLAERRDAAGLTNGDIDRHFGTAGMAGHWTSQLSQPAVPRWEQWLELRTLLGFDSADMDAEVWRLNGRKGKPGDRWQEAAVVGEYDGEPGGFGAHRFTVRDNLKREPSAEAAPWLGWGTALKPAWEPIILARKPLASTVAGNVLAYGTGAINVDACRVGLEGKQAHWDKYQPSGKIGFSGGEGEREGGAYNAAGRWPANVVLSHTPECREVGTRKVKGQKPGSFQREMTSRGYEGGGLGQRRADDHDAVDLSKPGYAGADGTETVTAWDCAPGCPVALLEPGGASRFFYCPKASRREREAGLEGMPGRAKANQYGDGLNSATKLATAAQQAAGTVDRGAAANVHPTVKPLALMRWLCRLVTPPGGLILDPFAGSGSTGCAALLEGFRFLGIELTNTEAEPFAAIARARLAYWERVARRYSRMLAYHRGMGGKVERRDPAQLGLFGDVA